MHSVALLMQRRSVDIEQKHARACERPLQLYSMFEHILT